MRRCSGWSVLALLPLAVGLQGCYSAVRTDPEMVSPGGELWLSLSEEGRDHLAAVSTRVADQVTGELQALTPDSITISTRLIQPSVASTDALRLRQSLTFARDDVREVTVPQLNRGRTAGIVVGAVVVVAYVLKDVLHFGSADTGDPTGGPDPGAPFWSFPW